MNPMRTTHFRLDLKEFEIFITRRARPRDVKLTTGTCNTISLQLIYF